MHPVVELDQVHKHFGKLHVLKGVSFSVQRGQVVAIIGQSGSGKSTALRCIDRLETIDSGRIQCCGHAVHDPALNLRALRKDVGIVFQSYNLFPHLTVLDNVTLASRVVHREMREQVVALEHRAEAGAYAVRVDARIGDVLVVEEDLPVIDGLEEVQASQQRGLARPARADERDHFVGRQLEVDAAEHLALPEGLVDAGRPQQSGHRIAPACSRSRSRAVYQSVSRMVGIASRMNSTPATTYGVKL